MYTTLTIETWLFNHVLKWTNTFILTYQTNFFCCFFFLEVTWKLSTIVPDFCLMGTVALNRSKESVGSPLFFLLETAIWGGSVSDGRFLKEINTGYIPGDV